jgi:hypothetical protein
MMGDDDDYACCLLPLLRLIVICPFSVPLFFDKSSELSQGESSVIESTQSSGLLTASLKAFWMLLVKIITSLFVFITRT